MRCQADGFAPPFPVAAHAWRPCQPTISLSESPEQPQTLPQGAALPQRCLDAALVDVRRLAKRSKSGQLDIVLARMLFASIQPLPASLPECGKKRGALRAREVC